MLAFILDEIECHSFNNYGAIETYVAEEDERLALVPIENFVRNNAEFAEDRYFGKGENWIKFNEEGFRAFCRLSGVPHDFILCLRKKTLLQRYLTTI